MNPNKFLPYEEVSQWAQKNNIKTGKQWYALGVKRPKNMPFNPPLSFKKDWKGWPAFLNVGKSWDQPWATYEEASLWAQNNNVKTKGEWAKLGEKRPPHIPACPNSLYKKGFVEKGGWSVFLNNGRPPKKRKWVSYEEAKKWAKSQGIVTVKDWKEKSAIRPSNIPVTLSQAYSEFKKEGWAGFVNNGKRPVTKNFVSYQEASDWVESNNITSAKEFRNSSDIRPTFIPSNPHMVYKNFKEDGGWKGFLKTNGKKRNSAPPKYTSKYASYEEAVLWAKENNIYSRNQWRKMGKNRPRNYPLFPDVIYKDKFLKNRGWSGFLPSPPPKLKKSAVKTIKSLKKKPRISHWGSYEEASQWAIDNKIRNYSEWIKKRPSCYPCGPHKVYKENWISWFEFLGTSRNFLSYKECSNWAKENGVDTQKKWQALKEGRPSNIPGNPWQKYKNEWVSWSHFLQIDRVAAQNRVYLSYEEASKWASENGVCTKEEWMSLGEKRPENIPAAANRVYKKQWKSWPEFLKTPKIAGASIVERQMRIIMDMVFAPNEDSHRKQQIVEDNGTVHNVDMAFPCIKLVVEYDGVRFHNNPKKEIYDKEKTKRLRKLGWNVVRLRENGCNILDQKWNIFVPTYGVAEKKVIPLLEHLLSLDKKGCINISSKQKVKMQALLSKIDMKFVLDKMREYTSFVSYEEAKKWAHKNKIKSKDQWGALKSNRPANMPSSPDIMYRDKWKGWPDFLGNGVRRKPKNVAWVTYQEASDWAKKFGVKSKTDWIRISKKRPENIPFSPDKVYSKQWVNWDCFLGKM